MGRDALGGAAAQRRVRRAVALRVLPVLWAAALLCQLDRGNLAFAALQLNADIGLTRAVYGLGAGLFFLGYALAQLPVTAACVAWGSRRCLVTILVVWGTLAAGFSLVRGQAAFLALRFCLGLAEAGAYPCFYYQLSLFYSPASLGVAYTWVASATALAGLLGAPLAAGLVSLDGAAGLRGWQWLFLVEGALPVALAAVLPLVLPASPLACAFLSPEEQCWLWESVHGERAGIELAAIQAAGGRAEAGLSSEEEEDHRGLAGAGCKEGSGAAAEPAAAVGSALRQGLADGRVWYLGAVMMGIDASMNSCNFFTAAIIEASIQGDFDTGTDHAPTLRQVVQASVLSALPFTAAAAAMLGNAYHSRRANERALHTAIPLTVAAAGLGLLPVLHRVLGTGGAILGLAAAASGIWATHGPFFSWPSEFLDPQAGALAFALVKMMGAVGGFCGPALVGLVAGRQGYGLAMLLLAGVCLLAALAVSVFSSGGRGGSRTRFLHLRWPTWRRKYDPLEEEDRGAGEGARGRAAEDLYR